MASSSLWPCSSTPSTTSSAVLSCSRAGFQIQAIGVQVDVAAAQRTFLPGLVLLLPVCLQLQDAARRQRRRLAHQRAEDRLEVTTGQPLQIQARHQPRLRARAPLVASHDLGVEPVRTDFWRHIADARQPDLDRAHADADGALGQVAIAIAAFVRVRALIAAHDQETHRLPLQARPGASCGLPRAPASRAHHPARGRVRSATEPDTVSTRRNLSSNWLG